MNKIAQRRGLLSQLREKINMPGAYLEGFFKPELDRVMASLKDLDDRVRSILTGKKIGNAEPPEDTASAKDLLASARTNFNRREYMAGVADLGRFHKKMYDVTRDIGKFFVDVNKIHHKFLFEGMPEEYQSHIKSLREHMGRKAETKSEYLIKEAGIMDFFYNIGTKRGRSLMAWEKKYPKQTKELRDGGNRLVDSAETLLEHTIAYLKDMATARAIRRPDDYMDAANRIKGEFDKFDSGDKGFRAYYNNVISPFLAIKDQIEAQETSAPPTQSPDTPKEKTEMGQQLPPAPIPPANVPIGVQVLPPAPPAPETEGPITQRSPAPKHAGFLTALESMGNEDPYVLAGFISKYASTVQDQDPEIALQLFSIINKLKA